MTASTSHSRSAGYPGVPPHPGGGVLPADGPIRLAGDAPAADTPTRPGPGEDASPRGVPDSAGGRWRSDEALMAAIQTGDEAALEELRRRYWVLLRSVVAQTLPCNADAEETVQDIFLEIWRMAANYDPARGKPLGWMIRMTRRRTIDRQRKNAVRFRVGQQLVAQAQANDLSLGSGGRPGEDESPVGWSDLRRFFERLLQGLPHAQREALELNFFGQLSQREIAKRTGIPLGTIKTRLELALKKLALLSAAYETELRGGHIRPGTGRLLSRENRLWAAR